MKIGELDVQPVYDGHAREPSTFLEAPGFDGDPWACHPDGLDDEGNIALTLGGFLIRVADRVILVDTGVGTIDNDDYHGGRFVESLSKLGVVPQDVTDVVFTHLHYDHVGWATQKGKIVFENATYRVHMADWDYFIEGPAALPGAVRKLAPIRDRLETFDRATTLAPGFDARPMPGHTPGTTVYVLSGAGQRALLLGDVAHSIVELTEDHWEAIYDADRDAGRAVRAAVVNEILDTTTLAAAGHFPELRFGRLISTDAKRQWVVV
jgi:glyoxylase-like metal-dependent hydrolase (beta-lactamase superfamily II)